MDDMNSDSRQTTATAPSPAQPKKERRHHPRREQRSESSQARGGRTLVEAPPCGTPEEQAKAVEAKLAQPQPVLRERRVAPAPRPRKTDKEIRRERQQAYDELFDREGTLCLEQKPDRPDSSHVCSVPSCDRWAGFDSGNNELAAVILLADGQARPVCEHHYDAACWGLRVRDIARDTGDRKTFDAYPGLYVYGSLALAKAALKRKAGSNSPPPKPASPKPLPRAPRPASASSSPKPAGRASEPRASSQQQFLSASIGEAFTSKAGGAKPEPKASAPKPDSARLEAKDRRRDARRLLAEILPPHLTGISIEQIARTLSQSAEVSDAAWESFTFCASEAIAKLDAKKTETEQALALLEAHRKEVRARS